MKHSIALSATVVLLFVSSALAKVGLDIGFDQAHTSNLLKNAGETDAWYTTPRASLRFYPLPTLEVSLSGEYTLYYGLDGDFTDLEDLSNFRGGLTLGFIPIQSDEGVSLFMEGNIDIQGYQDLFDDYNNNDASLTLTAGTVPYDNFRLRAGGSIQETAYTNSDDIDRSEFDFFGGLNWTLPGRNVLDAEFGVSLTSSTFLTKVFWWDAADDTTTNTNIPADGLTPIEAGDGSEMLSMLYISPRFSRPLGSKTGLSATFTWRKMPSSEDNIVMGISSNTASDVVSPWSSVWEGQSVSISVKTFLIPRLAVTWGAGYWHKEYLPAWEVRAQQVGEGFINRWTFVERIDDQRRTYLSVERPCRVGGCTLSLKASVDYTSNSSNHLLYDYEDVTITAAASLSL